MCIDWIETLAQVQHNREKSNNTKMWVCEMKVVWKIRCKRRLLKIAGALSAKRETITQQLKLETKYRLDDTLRAVSLQPCIICAHKVIKCLYF